MGQHAMKPTEFGALTPQLQRILVVEDDTLVRELVIEMLESFGYATVAVDGGLSALHLLESDSAFDVMLSDVTMPHGVSGFQLAREIRHRLPNLAIVLSSGLSGLSGDGEAAALHLSILRKPYRAGDLSRAIEAAVEAKGRL